MCVTNFAPCTCLPELEADSLRISSSGIPLSSPSSGTHTAAPSCASEQPKDGGPICACMSKTSGCLIHPNMREAWIASMRDSLAKTLASLGIALGFPKAREADFIEKCSELLGHFDPDTCSWKTFQPSLFPDSGQSLEIWPRAGMTVAGRAFRHRLPVPRTTAIAGGALQYVPTPTVSGNYNRKGASPTSGNGLATWAKMYPTPCARASKGSPPAALVRKNGRSRANDRIDHAIMAQDGGPLNPTWVEWLMGWPLGHTVSAHWGTAKSRSMQRSRGKSSAPRDDE